MKKKRTRKNSIETFTARNGITITYAPDPKASKPFTDEEWAKAKRVDVRKILTQDEMDAMSEVLGRIATRGRPRKAKPKVNATLRMDQDVLSGLRATGPGWQTRANDIIKTWLQEHGGA